MGVKIRIRNGLEVNESTGLGGANEGYLRGHHFDLIENVGGVVNLAGGHALVHENSPAAMNVIVDPGVVYIPNADFDEMDADTVKFWEAVIGAAETLTIGANSSGSTRIDLICVKMDTAIVPDEYASNIATLVVVEGTPGAGVPATPDNHYKLAEVEVVNGETAIEDASITDSRSQITIKPEMGGGQEATGAEVNQQTEQDKFISPYALAQSSLLNSPRGYLLNGKIVPSVTSNNLTVAIKTLSGTDPSATNPVWCRIGDSIRKITSALSVTKNAGTNYFKAGSTELATKEIDYFVYLGYNATDGVVIGFSRIPYATEYDDFSATSTNEKYCAISTITNAAAGDDYEVIGRFAATLSAGAGYTWSVPTFTNKNLIQRPIYETRLLTYIPVHTRVTTPYTNTPTVVFAYYKIVGNLMKVRESHTQNATPGGSGLCRFTTPFLNLIRAVAVGVETVVNGKNVVADLNTLGGVPYIFLTYYDYSNTDTANASFVVYSEYEI